MKTFWKVAKNLRRIYEICKILCKSGPRGRVADQRFMGEASFQRLDSRWRQQIRLVLRILRTGESSSKRDWPHSSRKKTHSISINLRKIPLAKVGWTHPHRGRPCMPEGWPFFERNLWRCVFGVVSGDFVAGFQLVGYVFLWLTLWCRSVERIFALQCTGILLREHSRPKWVLWAGCYINILQIVAFRICLIFFWWLNCQVWLTFGKVIAESKRAVFMDDSVGHKAHNWSYLRMNEIENFQ